VQLSAAFSRFLGKVSVTLDQYPSACFKPPPKPYEFPRDSQEADINQIVTARTNLRHEREKMYTSGKPNYVPTAKKEGKTVKNLVSWAILCDILQDLLHKLDLNLSTKPKKCYI